jgi:DNA-binding response OmpR family regulator
MLTTPEQETQLTPKVALLLELFMRQPGTTLDRKVLMEKVWQTEYMGDTRTLDVHVRWIRQAIEADPARPQLLKTVRGVGYCLQLNGQPKR